MSKFSEGLQRPPSGCGVQGCLFGAVALFAILLVGLLVVAFFRFQEPPQGLPRPPMGMSLAPGRPSPVTRRVGSGDPAMRPSRTVTPSSLASPSRSIRLTQAWAGERPAEPGGSTRPITDDRRPATGKQRGGAAHA